MYILNVSTPQEILHFRKVNTYIGAHGLLYIKFSTFKTGLGFGAAIGFISALIITTATVLTVLFVRARSTKGIQTFKARL